MLADPVTAGRLLLTTRYRVGIRCWGLSEDGRLRAPRANSANVEWHPSINRCECESASHGRYRTSRCWCGFYGFRTGKTHTSRQHGYFDMATAETLVVEGGVIGAIAYWKPRITMLNYANSDFFAAEYATATALTLPLSATAERRARIKLAAERYEVEIVKVRDLASATERWIAKAQAQYRPS